MSGWEQTFKPPGKPHPVPAQFRSAQLSPSPPQLWPTPRSFVPGQLAGSQLLLPPYQAATWTPGAQLAPHVPSLVCFCLPGTPAGDRTDFPVLWPKEHLIPLVAWLYCLDSLQGVAPVLVHRFFPGAPGQSQWIVQQAPGSLKIIQTVVNMCAFLERLIGLRTVSNSQGLWDPE